MKVWETQDESFEREAKMDWQNKSGNGEMAMERERGVGGGMGPVVVDMNATGAAEMEGDA